MGIVPLQYDRVDPTEFQSLKDELETLKTEKSATESQRTAQAEELTQLQEKVCDLYYSLSIRLTVTFLRSDCCVGENEQSAQRGHHEEQPDLPTAYGRLGCRKHTTQVEP